MKARILLISVLVAALTFLVFSGTLGHRFVNWDDDIYVLDNTRIHSLTLENVASWFTWPHYYAYIPLTLASHAIDYALWRTDARGHHLTNVILHACNAAWVFLVGLTFLRQMRQSASDDPSVPAHVATSDLVGVSVAALLFAFHPLRVESVAWVSDRKDLLCLFFLLPATICYLRFASQRGTVAGSRWYVGSFLLFTAGVLSKSVAVTFPLVLVTIDWLSALPGTFRQRWVVLLKEKAPFLAVSIIITLFSFTFSRNQKVAYAIAHLDGIEQWLFPFFSISFYIEKLAVPFHLSPIYPAPEFSRMVIGLVIVIVVSAIAVVLVTRNWRGGLVAWLSYLIVLLPTLGGLSSGMQPVADRYSYIATVGFFIVCGGAISTLWWRARRWGRLALIVVAGALVGMLAVLSIRQARYWESSERLWGSVIEQFPPSPDILDAYVNLSVAQFYSGQFVEARSVLQQAMQIDSRNPDVFYNLGLVLYVQGDLEGSLDAFRTTTRLDSKYAKAFFNLAIVSSTLGKEEEAYEAMKQAARLDHADAQKVLVARGMSW